MNKIAVIFTNEIGQIVIKENGDVVTKQKNQSDLIMLKVLNTVEIVDLINLANMRIMTNDEKIDVVLRLLQKK